MDEKEEDFDSAVMLFCKDDMIHIRSSDNLSADDMLEVLAAAVLALNNMRNGDTSASVAVH